VLGSGEEHFDADGNSEQLSKLSDEDYEVFRTGELLDVKKRVQKYNPEGEISDSFLTDFYSFMTSQAPLEVNTTASYKTVDGKWKSYGDERLDKVWLELVEATRVRFERDGTPFDETKMAKWSGTLAARLWLGWNYAPLKAQHASQYLKTCDPRNGCMIWAYRKLGIDRFLAEASGDILMSERFFHTEKVPSRKKKCPKEEDKEPALKQPYDSRPADIVNLHAQYRYDINEASSSVVDLELGERNVETFVERYKDDSNYTFIKMFKHSVYSKQKHDGCIVTGVDGKIRKLVVFVYHPEGSMHCGFPDAAERCDSQWNLVADIFHLRNGDRSMLYRHAKRNAPSPDMTKEDWEGRWKGFSTAIEMVKWEEEYGTQIERDDIPEQMRQIECDDSRHVPFVYDPAGKSYARQYLSNTGKEGYESGKATGFNLSAAGLAAQKERGFNLQAAGLAAQREKGFLNLEKARAVQIAAGTMGDASRAAQRAKGTLGVAAREVAAAKGHPGCVAGRAVQKAAGYDLQAVGRAALKAKGINLWEIGSGLGGEAKAAKSREQLTTLLQDDNHKEAQQWARGFDTKYGIIGKATGSLYDEHEIGLLARHAVYGKKCIARAKLGHILQMGTTRGDADHRCIKGRMETGGWKMEKMGTPF